MATYTVTIDGREFTIDANSPEEAAAKVSTQHGDVEAALEKERKYGGAVDVTRNLAEIPMRGVAGVAGYKAFGGPGIMGKILGGLGGSTAASVQTPGEAAGLLVGGAAGKAGGAAMNAARDMRAPRMLQQLLAPIMGGAGYEASTAAHAAADQKPFEELHDPKMLALFTLFPYFAERFLSSPVKKSPTAKGRELSEALTGRQVAPERIPELTPEAAVRPIYNRLENETVSPDTGAYPRFLQKQTRDLREHAAGVKAKQAEVKANVAEATAAGKARVEAKRPAEYSEKVEKGKSLADLRNDVIDLRASLRVEPAPVRRELLQMKIDDTRKLINEFGAEPVPTTGEIVKEKAIPTAPGAKSELARLGKQASAADLAAKRVDNLRKDFESFVERSKAKGEIGVNPRLERLGRTGSSEKFLDEVFHAPDEDFAELQKFLTNDEKTTLKDAFGEWFLKKAYDAKTGSLSKALDVAESLGSSKIARLHGGDLSAPRAIYRLSQDLKLLSEAHGASPTLTLAVLPNKRPALVIRSVRGLLVGAPSGLHERILRSPAFGEQFHQWALKGATQQALQSVPLVKQWLDEFQKVDAQPQGEQAAR